MRLALLLCAALAAGCTVDGGDGACVSERPLARSQAAAVLVGNTNQLFVYGGNVPSETVATRALWRFHFGTCSGWNSLAFDSSAGPGAVSVPAAAADTKRHRIVFASPTVSALDSDSLHWSELLTVGTPPTLIDHSWAVYDGDRDRLVVGGFGARQLSFASSDQGSWQSLEFLSLPEVVTTVSGAIDAKRGALYAFDGSSGKLYTYSLFVDRAAADAVAVSGDALPVDGDAHLGWNTVDERLFLFGSNGDVYRLDGSNATGDAVEVRRLPVSGELPPPRTRSAFGMSGNIAVIFGGATAGGCSLDDTWTFSVDDNQWTALARATTCP
jgi:hypothetical protein